MKKRLLLFIPLLLALGASTAVIADEKAKADEKPKKGVSTGFWFYRNRIGYGGLRQVHVTGFFISFERSVSLIFLRKRSYSCRLLLASRSKRLAFTACLSSFIFSAFRFLSISRRAFSRAKAS